MKKVTSAALLALKLTWKAVLPIFLLAALVQTVDVCRELMPGGVPLQTTFGFETLVRSAIQPAGKFWILVLLLSLTISAGHTRGSKSVYTMNRLGLCENHMALAFGGVFTGYFFLYWAFQVALAYGFFAWYSRFALAGSNTFMLAVWRSDWLHILLPLNEWWGYLRNIAICAGFGFSAAFGSTLSRHGKLVLPSFAPAVLCVVLLNGQIGEVYPAIGLTVLMAAFTIGYYFYLKGGREDEDL